MGLTFLSVNSIPSFFSNVDILRDTAVSFLLRRSFGFGTEQGMIGFGAEKLSCLLKWVHLS